MKSYLKIRDHSVSNEEFELVLDEGLRMLITRPQPRDLDGYYRSEQYISHTDSNKSFIDKVYQAVKKYSLKKKERLISKYNPKGRCLLDVGAGTGDFLVTARKNRWKVVGVEPNKEARIRAENKGIELFPSLDSLPNGKYDIVTLWHVLEHLPNLDDHIEKLVALLNESGTLVVAVPNFNSFDARHYREYWAAYDVPRHLWHFSKEAIGKLFSGHGMKVVAGQTLDF